MVIKEYEPIPHLKIDKQLINDAARQLLTQLLGKEVAI